MSALAKYLFACGKRVRGCDDRESENVASLRRLGIPVSIGVTDEIREDVVIYSGAIGKEHAMMKRALCSGKRTIARAELLGMILKEFPHSVAVSGCHGKTSCTAMIAHVFHACRLPFTSHIGGEDADFSNFLSLGREYFITEACEYQKNFLRLQPECAVILNIGRDHMDCYANEEELSDSFRLFAERAKGAIVNADDKKAKGIPHELSFGIGAGDIRPCLIAAEGEKYSFTISEKGKKRAEVRLSVVGRVQIYNALAAYAVGRYYGLSPDLIAEGLSRAKGVKRRFEKIGFFQGIPVVIDYAHHPAELAKTLATEKKRDGSFITVFQPHTYSRTKDLFGDFTDVLREFHPIIYKTYAAREEYDEGGSGKFLAYALHTDYAESPDELKRRLKNRLSEGGKVGCILVLGAGDIDEIAKSFLDQKSS